MLILTVYTMERKKSFNFYFIITTYAEFHLNKYTTIP